MTMRKTIFLTLSVFGLLFTSCSTQDDSANESKLSNLVFIKTTISSAQYAETEEKIKNKIDNTTRALGEELTESEAQELLKPFAVDGENICSQLIASSEELELTAEEVELLNSMTECQNAELSVALNGIEEEFVNGSSQIPYTLSDVGECLMQATGISSIGDLVKGDIKLESVIRYRNGTKALMSAKTAFQIAKALAVRTLGWVGIAWTMYDFTKCMVNKR